MMLTSLVTKLECAFKEEKEKEKVKVKDEKFRMSEVLHIPRE